MNIVAVVGLALDRARRPHRSSVDHAVGARVAPVLRPAGRGRGGAVEPLPGPGRAVRVDAPRLRARARVRCCGWCLWVNNLFYFPSLLLFAAANAVLVFGTRYAWLAESRLGTRWRSSWPRCWFCIGLNVLGLNAGKWLQDLGAVATWLPRCCSSASGAGGLRLVRVGHLVQRRFPGAARRLLVDGEPVVGHVLRLLGFRDLVVVGQEVRRPTRIDPARRGHRRRADHAHLRRRVRRRAGGRPAVTRSPSAAASPTRSQLVSARIGLTGLGALTGALLAIGSLAGHQCLGRRRGARAVRGRRRPCRCRLVRQAALAVPDAVRRAR